jgi:hypothetical protein
MDGHPSFSGVGVVIELSITVYSTDPPKQL